MFFSSGSSSRFCGKEKDEESGLYYYGMRYYNAWTCRFVSVDPLAGKTKNFSPYAYADCNPIMKNDPTGGKAENAGGGGDGGDGGGGEKASDGTGASDREGRDIVKVNNVSYETWKGKDGAIYAQKVEDVETGKGHSKVPVNKIANKAEREAIQSHWDTSAQESENMDTGNDPIDIVEKTKENPVVVETVSEEVAIPENVSSNEGNDADKEDTVLMDTIRDSFNSESNKAVRTVIKHTDKALETKHKLNERKIGKLEAKKERYKDIQRKKGIKHEKAIRKTNRSIKSIGAQNSVLKELRKITKPIKKYLDYANVTIEVANAFVKQTAEAIASAIIEVFFFLLSQVMKLANFFVATAIGLFLDWFKTTDTYNALRETFIDLIRGYGYE
ncbi:RHS repeat-associated core domain-containing protein [Cytophagaceae bacterium ABcell3]|nr:RHS repeat-associated core domain-containing protein [Cytophagaceae bacterium ABcell3]